MSNILGKNLHHLCFSIIKRPQPQITHPSNPNRDSEHDSSHQKSSSPSPSPPRPPYISFTKNYNSLFEDITSPSSVSDTDSDMPEAPVTPDLTAAYASRRFFISSPGRSNSIVDSLSTTSLSPEEDTDTPPAIPAIAGIAGGVAVETYSPDPYVDFRRSMQEMVEAREVAREGVLEAWEYLQELLLSYLSLNPKGTHKYIVRAFADLVVSSMSPIINHNNNNNNCSDNNISYVQIFNHAT